MTRHLFKLIITLTAITSCGQTKKETVNSDGVTIVATDIKGNWYFNKNADYNAFIFLDKYVINFHTDIPFTFGYEIKQDTLIITTLANQIFKNKIIQLTDDTLVIEGFADIKERRSYSRFNKHFN